MFPSLVPGRTALMCREDNALLQFTIFKNLTPNRTELGSWKDTM